MNTETAIAALQQHNSIRPIHPAVRRLFDPEVYSQIKDLAQMFAASTMVKPHFRGPKGSEGHANCFMALCMAVELGVDWLQALNQIHVVKGNVGFSGQLYIALANKRAPIRGRIMFEEAEGRCTAYATDRDTGARVEYSMSIEEIKNTEWYARNPIWKAQPKLMLRYRSAAYLVRTNFPEAMMGIQQTEELVDVHGTDHDEPISALNDKLQINHDEKPGELE